MRYSVFLLLLFLHLPPRARSYEASEDKEDVFAQTACPAFLTFINAAYVSGATVELPCLCKPQEIQSVVWFFRKHLTGSEETRALTDFHGKMLLDTSDIPHSRDLRSRFSIRLFSLLIFRAGPADAGIYICGSDHRDFFYAYDLDIQEAHKITFTPSLNSTRKRRRKQSDPERLYRVFTSFHPWSVCDRCGRPGEQVRMGLCYVHSRYLHVRYKRTNQTVASCGSGAVLRVFGRLNTEGAMMEVRKCQEVCPSQTPPSSKIVSLMAFLGYGSASKPVVVQVFYLNHPADTVLTMGCPGAKPNMAIAWDREEEPIFRSEHIETPGSTPPRVLIDTGHHLVFKPAETQDSGVYYCWLQGQRAAKIRLLVYTHLRKGRSVTSHPDFYPVLRMVLTSYAVMTAVFLLLQLIIAGVQHLRHSKDSHQD